MRGNLRPKGGLFVLSINAGADTGGVSWGFTRAFAGDPAINFRSAILSENYIGYPRDLPYAYPDIYRTWAAADVVHLHNNLRTLDHFTGRGRQQRKPYVLNHHGTKYRNGYAALNARVAADGARAVVSTVDLLQYGPDLTWAPACYDLAELAAMRAPAPTKGRRLRVGHAPTDRAVKSTEAFLAACDRVGVEPVLIERRPWRECLALKGTCDVLYDQVGLGYGNNAIEAWGMGIPVIAGAPDSTLATMREVFARPDGADPLPFYVATEATIADAIRALADEDTRAEYAQRGLEHVERFHSGAYTRAALTPIYQQLAANHGLVAPRTTPRPKPKPGTRDLIFRVGAPGEELRYAIRSQTTNLGGIGRVFTAGERVPWLTCPHINVPHQAGQDKYAHAYAVLMAILHDDDLTPEVIISDDDMHLLRPLDRLPSYTQGPVGRYLTTTRAQAWADTLAIVGPDAPLLDVHVPTVVDRARLRDILAAVDLPPERLHRVFWRTLHGPTGPLEHLCEPKIGRARTPWPDGPWVSTTERVLAPLRRLAAMFPEPSEWERAL